MAEDSLFALREVTRAYERWPEIDDMLRYVTPQAMLRDLHRPTTQFTVSMLDFQRHEISLDGGRGAVAGTKETLFKDYRVPITELVPTERMWRAAMAELRHTLSLPWSDAPTLGSQYIPAWKAGVW